MTSAPSREFKRRQREFVVQVRTDLAMPASAKLVCFVVSERWNEADGFARMSTDTIAEEAGMSQTNVRKMLKHPRMPVHMRIEPGRQGRGHTNRCWPIEHTGALSIGPTVDQADRLKEHFSTIKEHTGAMNLKNHTEGAPSVLPSLVDRQEQTTEVSARERAYCSLSGVHPKYPKTADDDAACRAIFFKELDSGTDPEQIISAAEHCENSDKTPPMILWLQQRRWQNNRY